MNPREYLQKKAATPTSFKKTENGTQYEYPMVIAKTFGTWCAKGRITGKDTSFTFYYSLLPQEQKDQITVTKIL